MNPARFSNGSSPVFYGAFDVETCLHECRVLAEDEICLATSLPTRDLTLLDLTDVPYDGADVGEGGDIFYFVNSAVVFGARTAEGPLLNERLIERRFDGLVDPSFFSDIRPDRRRYPNVALFGFPVREGLLTVHSLNAIRLGCIRYDYTFGPVLRSPTARDVEDIHRVLETADTGNRDWAEEIKRILSRSDPPD